MIGPLSPCAENPEPASLPSSGQPLDGDTSPQDILAASGLISDDAHSVFLMRVEGDFRAKGIRTTDVVVVNRSIEPDEKQVIVAALNGQFVVTQVKVKNNRLHFVSGHDEQTTLPVKDDVDVAVWGVVTHVIRQLA